MAIQLVYILITCYFVDVNRSCLLDTCLLSLVWDDGVFLSTESDIPGFAALECNMFIACASSPSSDIAGERVNELR